ncbi:MAG: hypothetical protein V4494_06240 [Chlamydiota bacterium]
MIFSFLRAKALQTADFAMGVIFPERVCSFVFEKIKEKRENHVLEVKQFSDQHHFFSSDHPLIGVVTEREQDVWLVADFLKLMFDKAPSAYLELMTMEVLAKILAFRCLKVGMELLIPIKGTLARYFVDQVILLDEGVPAFGLVAFNDTAPSLLLFRGTELSWKGRKSIVCDLDFKGVGYSRFIKTLPQISSWLKSAYQPQVLGLSLGGIFAIYALLYHYELVTSATVFGPPGLRGKAYQKWQELDLNKKLTVYVTKGDCVPKYGHLVGTIKEFSLDKKLYPLTAHTKLMTAEPSYYLA